MKQLLIQYKDKKYPKINTWYDYSTPPNGLVYLKRELRYLKSIGYKARIIERTTIHKIKVIE